MEITYRRNLSGSFMCIDTTESKIEERELVMLQKYRIPGLLPMQVMVSDGRLQYWYEITGKQQLSDYLAGKKIGKEDLDRLLYSMRLICEKIKEYLLLEERIYLEPEFLYMDMREEMMYAAYLPFQQRNLPEQFCCWMEEILKKIDHQDRAAAETAYGVYEKGRLENISMESILSECMPKITGEKQAAELKLREINAETGKEDEKIPKEKRNCLRVWAEQKIAGQIEKNQGAKVIHEKLSFILKNTSKVKKQEDLEFFQPLEEKKGLEAEREENKVRCPTEVLSREIGTPGGRLCYQGKHGCPDFWIDNKEEFLIGRNGSQADGIIQTEGVSRVHARILRQEGAYYLEDLNSTNGTYLNGELLEYHITRKINRNDRIRFGIEEYVFC